MMIHTVMVFIVLACLPAWGQPERKPEIENCTGPVYSAGEFRRIAGSMQMTIDELSDYPVIFPIKKPLRISSGFGMRYHPVDREWKFHAGIDISQTEGAPVYATGNGIVVRKGYCPGYGHYIEIEHAGGFRSFYAHLSRTMVSMGDTVRIATQIASVGSTGRSTGSHLHYEIRKGKRFLSPAVWGCLLCEIWNRQILNKKTA